jgi:hypothetical protein
MQVDTLLKRTHVQIGKLLKKLDKERPSLELRQSLTALQQLHESALKLRQEEQDKPKQTKKRTGKKADMNLTPWQRYIIGSALADRLTPETWQDFPFAAKLDEFGRPIEDEQGSPVLLSVKQAQAAWEAERVKSYERAARRAKRE